MKKRLTAILLSLFALLSLFPVTALAADSYDVYILQGSAYTGTRVTSENAGDVLGDGGSVSYNPDTCTLTLNHAEIAGIYTYGNESKTLTINVVGDSTITSQRLNAINLQASTTAGPVYHRDKLVITGEGTLTVNALYGSTVGISTYDDVTIENATVHINSASNLAIAVQTQYDPNQDSIDLTILNSTVTASTSGVATNVFWTAAGGIRIDHSDVTATAEASANPTLWAANAIEITGGSDVTATTGNGNAIFAQDAVKIDGSVVKAQGITSDNPAMYAYSVEITGGSDVTATVRGGNAICAEYGGILVDQSKVSATATGEYASFSAYCMGDFVVRNGSDVTAESAGDSGIYVEQDMSVTDSAVTAIGANYEGMVVYGGLDVQNSTLKVSRPTGSNSPALSVERLQVEASELTADGGIKFSNFATGDTEHIAFRVAPAEGKLLEVKVDDANTDGSAAVHFQMGPESPYDTAIEFDADAMKALSAYQYVSIREHVHEGGTATCTEKAVCQDCNRAYGDLDPENHTGKPVWTQTETTHSSTYDCCGAEAVAEEAHTWDDGVCSECGYSCQHPSYDPSWHSNETNHWNTCTCGAILNQAAHTFAWVTDQEATATQAGAKHEECTVCGYQKAAVEIPATGTTTDSSDENKKPETSTGNNSPTGSKQNAGTTAPKTGDNSNIALWSVALLAAGTVLTVTIRLSRKKKHS